MFQSWRWKIKQAEAACVAGRLDEAMRTLLQGDLRLFQPAQRVIDLLATAYRVRIETRLVATDFAGAWADLQCLAELIGPSAELQQERMRLVDAELDQALRLMEAGDACGAVAIIDGLERRKEFNDRARRIRDAARRLDAASQLQRTGRFAEAESQLRFAGNLLPETACIDRTIDNCHHKADACRRLNSQLHEAIADSAWSRVAVVADELLQVAPDYRLAQDARQRARAEAGGRPAMVNRPVPPAAQGMPVMIEQQGKLDGPQIPSRFRLWIDAVGGYLVCLADQVVLGQAIPGNKVDIPILGDLSRRHAIIRRQGEGYFIEPNHAVSVERQPVHEATLLSDGDEISLGSSVRLRFRKPHVLSATARLEFVSRHSTSPSADGILLMAESCVLGPRWQNHVVCRNWSADVILYRQDEKLYCRAMDSIQIDGQWTEGRGRIGENSRIAGADFALSLEVV